MFASENPDVPDLSEESQDGVNQKRGRKRQRKDKVYCLCRTSKEDGSMIQCDSCHEWFHKDCVDTLVNVDDKAFKRIDQFYCPLCCGDRSPIIFKKRSKKSVSASASRSNFNLNKSTNYDEDHDNYSPDDEEDDDNDDDEEFRISGKEKKSKKNFRKNELNIRRRLASGKLSTQKRGRRRGHTNKENKTKGKGRKKNTNKSQQHRRSRYKSASDDSQDEQVKHEGPRQCYGPGCTGQARKASKYCSDECGIQLATKRINQLIPGRIAEWQSTPCDADLRSIQELEQLRNEVSSFNEIIRKTVGTKEEVHALIERAKQTIPYTAEEAEEVLNREDFEYYVSCCICSSEVSIKQILRHMERCMAKCESQHVYGCTFRVANPYQLFCDTYSRKDKTYCRRLRVICTEHQKDTKDKDTKARSEDEVCGCPMPEDEERLFEEATGNFCRLRRKQCYMHHGWEKYRIAVVDSYLLSLMIRVDELLTKENKLAQVMRQRHGLVQMMLHRTIPPDSA